MFPRLRTLRVAGFRSLKDVTVDLTPVTVLIGANGAGKSNVLWALEMVRMLAFGSLQRFVAERGGATFLMHYGPKQTPVVEIALELETDRGENLYEARLAYGADESLIFVDEAASYRKTPSEPWRRTALGAGHRESGLASAAATDTTAKTVHHLLRQINFYHFHDTSRTSALRTRSFAGTVGEYLRSDGSNLPVFLDALKSSSDPGKSAAWKRLVGLLRRVTPFITDVVPTVTERGVVLQWRDDRGELFGPAHLSHGTLRLMALFAALAQPDATMPMVSCIDEPELGLHPAALEALCGLVSSVSARRQVMVSTQSPVVLDHFAPSDIVVAERHDGATVLRRLDPTALAGWLEEYSLADLYDKNVLGGRP